MPIDIRSVVDASVLAQIDRLTDEDAWSAEKFRSSIEHGCYAWAVWHQSLCVGFALIMQAVDEIELLKISVLPDYQRKGFATALLRAIGDFAHQKGVHACYLEVRASNRVAQALYKKQGFECVGVRKAYYSLTAKSTVESGEGKRPLDTTLGSDVVMPVMESAVQSHREDALIFRCQYDSPEFKR